MKPLNFAKLNGVGNYSEGQSESDFSDVGSPPPEVTAQKEAARNLLKLRKFYTNRNFDFVGLFTQNSKDINFKLRFNKSMPKKNPMLPSPSSIDKNRRRSMDPTALTNQQLLHLDSGHFSRWAGCESKAIGLSPNPIFLQRRKMSEARATIKSQQNNARRQMNLMIHTNGKG